MHKYIMVALLIAGSLLGMIYAFVAVMDAEEQRVEPPAENELRITASNWTFDEEVYTVTAGETLTVTLFNDTGIHGAAIDELDFEVTSEEPVEFTFDEPGTYDMYCSILCGEGHADMTAQFVVE